MTIPVRNYKFIRKIKYYDSMEEVESTLQNFEKKSETTNMSTFASARPAKMFRRLHPEEYYKTFISKEIRPDGRKLFDARNLVITPSASEKKSFGSSLVKIGNTTVLGSIDVDISEPSIEKRSSGYIMLHTHIPRMGSPQFRKREVKNEILDLISHFLEERIVQLVDLTELCIVEGESVFELHLHISVLSYDGNSFDASLLSLVSTLLDFRFPEYEVLEEERKIKILKNRSEKRLTISKIPISQTFGIINDQIIVDPTGEEEDICGSVFSVLYDSDSKLMCIHKPGGNALSDKNLLEALKVSKGRIPLILKLVKFGEE